jgi:O-antigen/teichoic acid export membrane protein
MVEVIKAFGWISSGQMIVLVGNFLLLKILTDELSVADYGSYALVMSLMLFARQAVVDPLSVVVAKGTREGGFLRYEGVSSLQVVRGAVEYIGALAPSVLLGLFIVVYLVTGSVWPGAYIIILCVYFVANGAQGVFFNLLNMLRSRRLVALGVSADSFIRLIFVFIFINIFSATLGYTLLAVSLASLVVFCGLSVVVKGYDLSGTLIDAERRQLKRDIALLTLPLIAPCVVSALRGVSDKALMASVLGIEQLAGYNVLFQLGFLPMTLILGIVQTYAGPNIYRLAASEEAAKEKTIKYVVRLLLVMTLASALATFLSALLSERLFKLLIGSEYLGYSFYLPLFVAAGALSAVASLLGIVVVGAFKSRVAGTLTFISVLSGMVVLAASIAFYGFDGGAVGLLISNLVACVILAGAVFYLPFSSDAW